MTWAMVAAGAGTLLGGWLSSKAAKDAANTQAQSGQQANELQWKMFQQQQANMQPWMQAGRGALQMLTGYGMKPQGQQGSIPTQALPQAQPTASPQMLQAMNQAARVAGGLGPGGFGGGMGGLLNGMTGYQATVPEALPQQFGAMGTVAAPGASPMMMPQTAPVASAYMAGGNRKAMEGGPDAVMPSWWTDTRDKITGGAKVGLSPSLSLDPILGKPLTNLGNKVLDKVNPKTEAPAPANYGDLNLQYSDEPMGGLLGMGGEFNRNFSMADYQQDPGYAFRLQQGQKALQGSAAAKGGLLSGGALKALTRYGQDMGSQEYGNAYNRWSNDITNRYNRLASTAGLGQQANTQLNQLGSNYAGNVGNTLMGISNAQAAGQVGQANAWSNALNSGLNNWLTYNMMNKG